MHTEGWPSGTGHLEGGNKTGKKGGEREEGGEGGERKKEEEEEGGRNRDRHRGVTPSPAYQEGPVSLQACQQAG